MTNQTSIEQLVEELQAEFFDKFIAPTIPGTLGAVQADHIRLWFEKKLPSALSQARREGRIEAVEYIEQNGAPEWDADWNDDEKGITGYSVSTEQLAALTTEGK